MTSEVVLIVPLAVELTHVPAKVVSKLSYTSIQVPREPAVPVALPVNSVPESPDTPVFVAMQILTLPTNALTRAVKPVGGVTAVKVVLPRKVQRSSRLVVVVTGQVAPGDKVDVVDTVPCAWKVGLVTA